MIQSHWRHFSPRRLTKYVQKKHITSDLFSQAQEVVADRTRHLNVHRGDISQLDTVIYQVKHTDDLSNPVTQLALLILQAPRAARAQQDMDKHPHGYHNRTERLYELIDFNDTYIDAVLSVPEYELSTFDDHAKRVTDIFCKRLRTRCFSNEQWEAITHGLSREVAVYRGAIKEGLLARMTSRVQDAKGVDMVITDPANKRTMNVDIKTGSAYHYRLKDLEREGRITSEEFKHADESGYCPVINGHGAESVEVVLLRIDHDVLGNIVDFEFENSHLLGGELRKILATVGR